MVNCLFLFLVYLLKKVLKVCFSATIYLSAMFLGCCSIFWIILEEYLIEKTSGIDYYNYTIIIFISFVICYNDMIVFYVIIISRIICHK